VAQTFSCPSCGATLEYDGKGRTAKCQFCGTVAQVPQEFWQSVERAQTMEQWKKWIVLFLVVTVVIPTCLGIVGTVLGIGGGILGALAPFILSLF
jgi:hypothetical protein